MIKSAKDWPHQDKEYRIGRDKRARALLWPMRSGKSKACIDKMCYQFSKGNIEGGLILAPNGVHLNWIKNEIPKWSWPQLGMPAGFAWSTPKRFDAEQLHLFNSMLEHHGPKWMAVNMEALKHPDNQDAVRKFILSTHRKFMLIVSESHHFGRPGSRRSYWARSLSRSAAFRTIESGTAILNSPLKAFSQYDILNRGALGFQKYQDFERFHVSYVRDKRHNGREFFKVDKYEHMDELRANLAKWSSVVLREELRGMPNLIRTVRPVVMSDLQRDAYLQMVEHHLAEIGDMRIETPDGGARVQKLQQITHGYVMHEGEIITIDPNPPIYDALMEQIDGTLPGKSLVWCRYREDIRRVVAYLDHNGYRGHILEYHGGISTDRREATRFAFQTDPKWLVCVGQPAAGGEGLDFSAADAVIYFSAVPNATMMTQSEERATLIGGKPIASVRITTPGTVNDRIWDIVDDRVTLADSVSGRGLRDLLMETDI